MDLEVFYRRKRRMFNDMLEIGWSFGTILSRLRLNYTDYIYLYPEKPDLLAFFKIVDLPNKESNYNFYIPRPVDYLHDDGIYQVFNIRNKNEQEYIMRFKDEVDFIDFHSSDGSVSEIEERLKNKKLNG
jgi:hypothetical protein